MIPEMQTAPPSRHEGESDTRGRSGARGPVVRGLPGTTFWELHLTGVSPGGCFPWATFWELYPSGVPLAGAGLARRGPG